MLKDRDDEGLGRRCAVGCETWPDTDDYRKCPQCGETTKRFSAVSPLDEDEARSKRLHFEFEQYYEDRAA